MRYQRGLYPYVRRKGVASVDNIYADREKVVFLLNSVLSVFARNVADENNYRGGEIPCFLKPFGSYGLGGYIRDADIDIVLICSQLIKRRDFFRFFPDTLRHLPTVREIEVSSGVLQTSWLTDAMPSSLSRRRMCLLSSVSSTTFQ